MSGVSKEREGSREGDGDGQREETVRKLMRSDSETEEGVDYLSLTSAFEIESESENEPLDDYEDLDIGEFNFHFVRHHLVSPKRILLKDKLTYVLGFVQCWLGAYWLGRSPETFHKMYCVQAVVLFSLRWLSYKRSKMHYYLFDFCYFANALLVLLIWFFPNSNFLFKICFAYNSGPLAWSIVAFRNSLVYHSLDKVTSLFLHWCPMMVSWTLRWYPDPNLVKPEMLESKGYFDLGLFLDLAIVPLFPYFLWAVLYYLKIFVVSSKKIQDRGYETLFKYMTSNKRSAFAKFVLRYPQRYQPLVYMACHLAFFLLTLILSLIWWKSFVAHTVFISVATLVSVWNGANYYFEVFARRYMAGIGLKEN